MPDVYAHCPTYENELIQLRPLAVEDASALFRCYSDPHAVPFFNDDNCNGGFHFTTLEQTRQAVDMWLYSYATRQFVRWTIVEQSLGEAIGTVEMLHRLSDDEHNHAGVLRVDVQSRFETRATLHAIFAECLRHFYEDFAVDRILTKAIPLAVERRAALESCGFTPMDNGLMGYPHYFLRKR